MDSSDLDRQVNRKKWIDEAKALIDRSSTLVLATSQTNRPWAAPVYYVYVAPAFYFFSSPSSRHVQDALANQNNAAALFADADRWEQIEGVQMVGRILLVKKKIERLKVTAKYLKKFPLSKNLLSGKDKGNLDLSAKVGLYAFYPEVVYYMNNLMGFGSRFELKLR